MSEVVATQLSVRDLKTHLWEWLDRVARLTAIKQPDSTAANPLQNAIDAGIVSWNGQKPVFPPPEKLRGQGKRVSEIVMEDRG